MSKKNANKTMLDNIEFEFDQVLIKLRELDEAGKFNKKTTISAKTLQHLVGRVASEVLEQEAKPIKW